jgi:hypothetical protein
LPLIFPELDNENPRRRGKGEEQTAP